MGMFYNLVSNIRYGIVLPKKKNAQECREEAREKLRGRWGMAVLTGIVASLFGASGGSGFSFGSTGSYADVNLDSISADFSAAILGVLSVALFAGVVLAILFSVLVSGVVRVGYERFNLDLLKGKGKIETLFDFFRKGNYKKTVRLNVRYTLMMCLYALPLAFAVGAGVGAMLGGLILGVCVLWALAVPAAAYLIVAVYRYSMTFKVFAEDPTLTAKEAMDRSSAIMNGRKWDLFCLEFSFIGWIFLGVLSCGIGMLWVIPYQQTAYASFYQNAVLYHKYGRE